MIDRKAFFAHARERPFNGWLSQPQVDGMTRILDEWERRGLSDARHLAYMLATCFHETATRMQPVIETRQADEAVNPSVDEAIRRLDKAWAAGKMPWVKSPYWRKNSAGLSFLGRGLPQLTGEDNYRRMSPLCGVDLVANPDRALDDDCAIPIMFEGMLNGMFTGKKLADYFGPGKNDPVGARHIINGSDKADLIAGYHHDFLLAIGAIGALVATAPAIPSPGPVATAPASPSLWARVVAAVTGRKVG